MDLWTALFTVFRRWYVSLPIAVLGVVATIMIGGRIEQQYEAKASVVLVPAPYKLVNGISQPPENPYDPRGAAAAVYRRVSSPDLQREFEADGDSKDFTVTLDQNAAIIDFTVTGDGEEEALQTAERLVNETKTNLSRIQSAALVEEDAAISMNLINISTEAEPVKGNKPRVMATIFVLGMVAAISAAFIVESFGVRRRQREAGVLPGAGVPPMAPYPYPTMPGQVAPAGYMPVVPVATVVAAEPAMPVAAPAVPEAVASGPADLYGSVDDLIDDLDAPSNGADDPTGRPGKGSNGVQARNGKGNGAADGAERKAIDGGRRGRKPGDRPAVPATDSGANGRPGSPARDGGGSPSDVEASADGLIDLTAAPVELDEVEEQTARGTLGRRTQVAGGRATGTIEATTTGAATPQSAPVDAGHDAAVAETATDATATAADASAEATQTAAVEAAAAERASDPSAGDVERAAVQAKDLGLKRPPTGTARNGAASRTTAKSGRRPAGDDTEPASTTVNAGTPTNARMRDGAKGRRASLFSASGDRAKDETPPAS